MAMTPEARVKAAVKKVLDEVGAWYYMPVQNGFGTVGIPDFMGTWHGRSFAVETKAPGKLNTVTANQSRVLAEIIQAGGKAWVVDDAETLRKEFRVWQTQLRMEGVIDPPMGFTGGS